MSNQGNNTVATTIIEQLGGMSSMYMIGASRFPIVAGENSVRFKVTKTAIGSVYCTIELNADDTYNMIFQGTRMTKNYTFKEKARFDGIYCDQLRTIFQQTTEMYLSLNRM